jgi:hypothetical protein
MVQAGIRVFANELARAHPEQAIAILVARVGGYRVSLRAPRGIQNLARQFGTGSGRERAAGISSCRSRTSSGFSNCSSATTPRRRT